MPIECVDATISSRSWTPLGSSVRRLVAQGHGGADGRRRRCDASRARRLARARQRVRAIRARRRLPRRDADARCTSRLSTQIERAVGNGVHALALSARRVARPTRVSSSGGRGSSASGRRRASLALGCETILELDVRNVLPLVDVPTLVVHSRDNAFVRVGHGRYLAEHISGRALVERDSADHWPLAGLRPRRSDRGVRHRLAPAGLPTPIACSPRCSSSTSSARPSIASRARRPHAGRSPSSRFEQVVRDGSRSIYEGDARATPPATGSSRRSTARPALFAVLGASATKPAGSGLEVRCGLHAGEITRRSDSVAGIAVHIGARVSALAAPGEVLGHAYGARPRRRLRDRVRGARRARAQRRSGPRGRSTRSSADAVAFRPCRRSGAPRSSRSGPPVSSSRSSSSPGWRARASGCSRRRRTREPISLRRSSRSSPSRSRFARPIEGTRTDTQRHRTSQRSQRPASSSSSASASPSRRSCGLRASSTSRWSRRGGRSPRSGSCSSSTRRERWCRCAARASIAATRFSPTRSTSAATSPGPSPFSPA